ncbi:MAG: hypothetical protein MJZ81_10295 [Bacteroidales bacterium]|nr:hypothetical protein [Bacteroidales bacterium]
MNNIRNHKFSFFVAVAMSVMIFSSCHKDAPTVYEVLEGSWALNGITYPETKQALMFFWNSGAFWCDSRGYQRPITADLGDGDGRYEAIPFVKRNGDTIVRFSYETYDAIDGTYVTHSRDFLYHSAGENTIYLTERFHLLSENDLTYRFERM